MNRTELNQDGIFFATGGTDWVDGQPVLCFLHGVALDRTVWTLFSRYFARTGYNVLTPDLPGHGKSSESALTTVEAMADWVNGLLDRCGASQVSLVGHSLGSLIALEACARKPARVTHLLLLGTSVPMPVSDALLDAAKRNSREADQMIALFGHAHAAQLGGNPVSGISVVNTALALMAQAREDVMYTGLSACNLYTNGLSAARKVNAKTTLIVGAEDKMTPVSGIRELCQTMPEAVVETLQCGHMLMSEQPEACLQAMLTALR